MTLATQRLQLSFFFQTLVCECTRTKQYGYTFNYVNESRITNYFVSDILHLDTKS